MDQNPFGKGLDDLMSQLQQAQSQLENIQEQMSGKDFEGEAGNGVVKVVVNGQLELLSVKIDPRAMDPEDPGMLEDLVLTAVNRAMTEAREQMAREMSQGLFGGKLPGMF